MKKHIETLVPGFNYHVSSNGRFLRIKGREVSIKGKVTILPWQKEKEE